MQNNSGNEATYYTRNRKTNSLKKQTSAGGNNAFSNTGYDT